MLWYKGWLETRFRVLFQLGIFLFIMGLFSRTMSPRPMSHVQVEALLNSFTIYMLIIPAMLAGAGIKTQPILRSTRGLHGSMYFTLSLPVSRLRLLATRAGLGILETVGILATSSFVAWLMFPVLRGHLTGSDLFAYWVTASICISAFYSLSVLFATFWDDLWQIWGSMIAILILRWLPTAVSVPPSLNIFRAMGQSSPLFTHTYPWASIGVSLGAAAILFLAALKVVQTREY
jgi:hypothetical protein